MVFHRALGHAAFNACFVNGLKRVNSADSPVTRAAEDPVDFSRNSRNRHHTGRKTSGACRR
jgi:hypothetical protein